MERSGIQDVNIFTISLKSRIQKQFVIKVLLHIPLISSAVVMYPLLWMHGCLVLTPMTLPGISSQFQEPHPSEGSREDFLKGWRIWGWCWMCVDYHVYSKSFMNTLCIDCVDMYRYLFYEYVFWIHRIIWKPICVANLYDALIYPYHIIYVHIFVYVWRHCKWMERV